MSISKRACYAHGWCHSCHNSYGSKPLNSILCIAYVTPAIRSTEGPSVQQQAPHTGGTFPCKTSPGATPEREPDTQSMIPS
ncbi:hypothetical protein COCOBI_06-5850 [Coccomyxa sp. Obi]|nr:hypothetical protein COCOBI_06-5850 [Coccomyxa sp. Obi]